MIENYKSTVHTFAVALQTLLVSSYVSGVRKNMGTGDSIVKAAVYTPIVITMDVFKSVVSMYEELLKALLMQNSELHQIKPSSRGLQVQQAALAEPRRHSDYEDY
jgi:hypothetical protein